jgi:hypothetical protein
LYIDGVKVSSGTITHALGKIGIPFAVGKQNCSPCPANAFSGAFDELAIYDKALAEDRIFAHLAAAR